MKSSEENTHSEGREEGREIMSPVIWEERPQICFSDRKRVKQDRSCDLLVSRSPRLDQRQHFQHDESKGEWLRQILHRTVENVGEGSNPVSIVRLLDHISTLKVEQMIGLTIQNSSDSGKIMEMMSGRPAEKQSCREIESRKRVRESTRPLADFRQAIKIDQNEFAVQTTELIWLQQKSDSVASFKRKASILVLKIEPVLTSR